MYSGIVQGGWRMREIKFRAWDTKDKVMRSNTELCLIENSKMTTMKGLILDGIGTNTLDCTPLESILMQYTGLKDKNNREIFEGDILQESYDFDNKITKSRAQQVIWIDKNACFGLIPSNPYEYTDLNFHPDREIIGNIYENPELLNGN